MDIAIWAVMDLGRYGHTPFRQEDIIFVATVYIQNNYRTRFISQNTCLKQG